MVTLMCIVCRCCWPYAETAWLKSTCAMDIQVFGFLEKSVTITNFIFITNHIKKRFSIQKRLINIVLKRKGCPLVMIRYYCGLFWFEETRCYLRVSMGIILSNLVITQMDTRPMENRQEVR